MIQDTGMLIQQPLNLEPTFEELQARIAIQLPAHDAVIANLRAQITAATAARDALLKHTPIKCGCGAVQMYHVRSQ